MKKSMDRILRGYQGFRKKYAIGDESVMQHLAYNGQQPEVMVVACCDSRVDPSIILQCEPGDLFIVRNVANIIPPYESDDGHHGTSAALEFGICFLNVKHLIILGHSQCGGIDALISGCNFSKNDFISNWVSQVKLDPEHLDVSCVSQLSIAKSYENCFTFPWIKQKVDLGLLQIHQWYFDIKEGEILVYNHQRDRYLPLNNH